VWPPATGSPQTARSPVNGFAIMRINRQRKSPPKGTVVEDVRQKRPGHRQRLPLRGIRPGGQTAQTGRHGVRKGVAGRKRNARKLPASLSLLKRASRDRPTRHVCARDRATQRARVEPSKGFSCKPRCRQRPRSKTESLRRPCRKKGSNVPGDLLACPWFPTRRNGVFASGGTNGDSRETILRYVAGSGGTRRAECLARR